MSNAGFRLITRVLVVLLLMALLLPGLPARVQAGGSGGGSLLHDSLRDLFRTPLGAVPVGTTVTLRFQAPTGSVDLVTLRLWDSFTEKQTLLPMRVVATTPEGYEFWEASFPVGRTPTVYTYRFLLTRGSETTYYEDDYRPSALDGAYFPARDGGPGMEYSESPDLPWQITVYNPDYYTPEWMRNAVIYQIFPDRFRNGDPANDPADDSLEFYDGQRAIFHETWNEPPVDPRLPGEYANRWNVDFFGGDLAGIIEKLDYLQDLGITAIYLNPIFAARSNHRYDTADYKAIDPLLGDLQTFNTLVSEAQQRGMVLILDGVFNHLSSDSPFFDRYGRYQEVGACESLDSPYRNWFFFVPPKGEQPSVCVQNPQGATYYTSWAGYDSIPKINSEHAGPRLYFFTGRNSVVNFWGRLGIGGWRLDVSGDIDAGPTSDYWEGFRVAVRNANPEAVIIGEEWGDASKWLLGKEWDSVMNYQLRRGLLGFVRETDYFDNDSNGDRVIHALTAPELDGLIRGIESDYPPMAYHAMMNLLGSHDVSRVLYVAGDTGRQKLAALLQFALPGAPTIYYGDEIALDAPSVDAGGTVQDDPYNRAPYPWDDTAGDAYGPPDAEMLAYYQALSAFRHAHPALRQGQMITLVADGSTGVYAFLRLDAATGSAAIVVANNSDSAQKVPLKFMFLLPLGLTLESALGSAPISTDNGFAVVSVPANGGDIWAATTGEPFSLPPAPANVIAEGAPGSVSLRWDAVEGAAGYLVYRSPVATGGYERVSWYVDEPAFVDNDVTSGFRYYYAVAALSDASLPGPLSAGAPAIPSAPIAGVGYAMADQPADMTLSYGAVATIRATVRVEGLTEADGRGIGVRAEALLNPAGAEIPAESGWVTMRYVGDADGADVYEAAVPLSAPGDYDQMARFSTSAGETWTIVTQTDGAPFPPLSVRAPDDAEAPAPPAAAEIVEASLAGVILRWDASPSEDVAAYRIFRTLGKDTVVVADVLADAELRYHDKAVSAGSTYTYAVAAVDRALNESAPLTVGEAKVQRRGIPVIFTVTVPDYTKEGKGDVYIAGDLGTPDLPFWDPAGLVMTQIDDQHWTITLELPEGAKIQYKYVRGTWNAVEKGLECEEIANRMLTVEVPEGATELIVDGDVVAKWRDLDKCG